MLVHMGILVLHLDRIELTWHMLAIRCEPRKYGERLAAIMLVSHKTKGTDQ